MVFLTDPEPVASCAPGLESIEVVEPGRRFRAVAAVGFGAVKARFVNEVEWLDLDPPQRARMKPRHAPGSAVDALSEMALTDERTARRSSAGGRESPSSGRSPASRRG